MRDESSVKIFLRPLMPQSSVWSRSAFSRSIMVLSSSEVPPASPSTMGSFSIMRTRTTTSWLMSPLTWPACTSRTSPPYRFRIFSSTKVTSSSMWRTRSLVLLSWMRSTHGRNMRTSMLSSLIHSSRIRSSTGWSSGITVERGFGSYTIMVCATTSLSSVYSRLARYLSATVSRVALGSLWVANWTAAWSFASSMKMVRLGVLICFETLMSSSMRGTPRVTSLAELPAWWKVFRVICVAGSPMDCAARMPTISPGATCAR
mmetsp:Transcript_20286/g.61607  ORF Transcript_20286/g.61607 Transcript_20286/m.61607 type:complete len:260 (+) Transcript_20286:1031-1810(+)